jgi:hypothetical protein
MTAGNFMLCDVNDVEVVAVKRVLVLDADGLKGAWCCCENSHQYNERKKPRNTDDHKHSIHGL